MTRIREEEDVSLCDWIKAVSLGCFVSLCTSSFRTNWYHLMPSSIHRHHWSSASILRASVLELHARNDDDERIIPCPCIPCLVDICKCVCELSCSQIGQTAERNNHITPPWWSNKSERQWMPRTANLVPCLIAECCHLAN